MEEVVEGVGRLIFRTIKWLIIDALVEFVIQGIGHITLKIITLGRYPRPNRDEGRTVLTGLITIALIVFVVVMSTH